MTTYPWLIKETVLSADVELSELGAFCQDELDRRRGYGALVQGQRPQTPHIWHKGLYVG